MSDDVTVPQYYDAKDIQVHPFPIAQDCSNGWWRFTWKVETEPKTLPASLQLPLPQAARFREMPESLIIAILPREPGYLSVELLSLYQIIRVQDAVYISLVMQAIAAQYADITIDGFRDHSMLRFAK